MVTFEGHTLTTKGRKDATWGVVYLYDRSRWASNPTEAPKEDGTLFKYLREETARENVSGTWFLVRFVDGTWVRA